MRENIQTKLKLIVMKAFHKDSPMGKYGDVKRYEMVTVKRKNGTTFQRKQLVGTKKKETEPKAKGIEKEIKPKKKGTGKVKGKEKNIDNTQLKADKWGRTIYPKQDEEGKPIVTPAHSYQPPFEDTYGKNPKNYKALISKFSIVSDDSLDFGYKVKKHPLWLEETLKNVKPSSFTAQGFHGIKQDDPEHTRKMDVLFNHTIPLLKKNKIPYSLLYKTQIGRPYFNKRLNREMLYDTNIARNIEPSDIKRTGLKESDRRITQEESLAVFLTRLRIYIDKEHLPKAMELMDSLNDAKPKKGSGNRRKK